MTDPAGNPPATPPGLCRRIMDRLHGVENGIVVLALGAMMLLPLIEIVLRKFKTGLAGSQQIVQHLTLAVGMLGGALAARESRLLCMSALPTVFKGRWKLAAAVFSNGVAATFTLLLCIGSVQFVLLERESGNKLAYDIPIWWIETLFPIGFGLVAARLWWTAAERWVGRVFTLILAGSLFWFAAKTSIEPARLTSVAFVVLLAATILGAPVFVTLSGAAMILFWGDGLPIASLPLDHYRLVTNPTLPSIPLFTMAGYFLAEGGASKRLVRVFHSLVGQFRGGPAIVTCLVCAFFTTFTGASGVTILALGGLLMPVLIAERYSERNALGLVTTAGALGLLFPPCLPLILYAIIAKSVSIEQIFLGGIVPGILMVVLTAAMGIWQGPKIPAEGKHFDAREARTALWDAKWELLLPVVAFAGLFGGFATPVETAALTALYAFCVETFVYRDLRLFRDVPRVMTECGLVIGGVLLILGVALGFTNYLVDAQIAGKALDWVKTNIHSPLVFLLALNLLLLIVGCLMDIYSAIIVVVPLVAPMGAAFGIDPIHLGIIFLANLELGYLTPPVGMNLFLASYRFKKPLPEVYRSVMPMLAVRFVGVLVITYAPALTTMLPKIIGKLPPVQ
jgi:tripartite ATP-independent transporter DctM subunit